ncbi:hypothetical protein [Maricaulis sp.]|uniref:hypothetical protein n=1 Tax=Maricaulis sp. TaxID=1486257 RepID=UPI0026172ABF|nr:hypothetical protein [Maricaulis sp.]
MLTRKQVLDFCHAALLGLSGLAVIWFGGWTYLGAQSGASALELGLLVAAAGLSLVYVVLLLRRRGASLWPALLMLGVTGLALLSDTPAPAFTEGKVWMSFGGWQLILVTTATLTLLGHLKLGEGLGERVLARMLRPISRLFHLAEDVTPD